MPQLNPASWFIVFLVVWLALMLYNTKTVKFQQPNMPTTHQTQNKNPAHWQWP
nr:ATP synthase F0 subunit 8 [Aspidoscelis tesselatus]UXX18275.1 ATP synthase F0 subunit 8 [Aspidoscelis tesselatus]UXX18288.1 ATP synthase F0 subunit 8 [Aspidoscelis tesselatus]